MKIFFLLLHTLVFSSTVQSPIYINIIVSQDEIIYLENKEIAFENISKEINKRVSNIKFVVGQKIIYRIFADGNLKMGNIIDVQQKMHEGFTDINIKTEKYLINSNEIHLDGKLRNYNTLKIKALKLN